MNRIVLLGSPGSGKGTQGTLLFLLASTKKNRVLGRIPIALGVTVAPTEESQEPFSRAAC